MLSSCRITQLVTAFRKLSTNPAPVQSAFKTNRQVWVENFNTPEEKKVGLLELHPEIFGAQPRIDIIYENIEWQNKYRYVSFATTKTRSEGGGVAHGPRSPKTHFYMLPFYTRVLGLTSTLSVKLAQDDLHVVDELNAPTGDPSFIKDLIKERGWGPSVLIIDVDDVFPENVCLATDKIGFVNLMPVFGLNVYSMLKHDTLVLTAQAAKAIEEKLLYQLNRADACSAGMKFKLNQV